MEYSRGGLPETIRLPANNSGGVSPVYALGYDSAGRLTSVTDPLNRVTTAVYDSLDRLTQATLPNPGTGATGFVWQQSYDSMPYDGKFGVTSTDFNGATTTSYLDVWGHLTKLVDAAGNEVKLAWSNGLPVEIEDAEHNRTTYTYDDLQRLEQILHPEGTTTQFTYAPTSRVLTRRDRKNQVTTFGYDELGRIVSRQYPEGTISYEYSGPVVSTVRDNAQGGGEKLTSYVYDQSLRLTSVTNDRGVVEYRWLPGDMLGGYRLDGGAWINYTYYPSGDMHTIQREGDASPFEYTYLIDGARQMLRYSNGSTVNYTWDDLGRVLALTNLDPSGGLISRYSYLYDLDHASGQFTKKGLRVAMTEDLPSGSTGQEQYFFDNLYQLTRTIYPNGENHAWTYDRIGNRMSSSITIPPDPPVVNNYSYFSNGRGGNSQLLQSDGVNTYTWDANGNMATKTAQDGIHYYSWNSRNLLTGITAPYLQASYGYDFLARRVSRTLNSSPSSWQYSGWDMVKEAPSGSEYLFGADIDEILETREASAGRLHFGDVFGSVRQIHSEDTQTLSAYTYDVWGARDGLTESVASTFQYAGREALGDDLMSYRARSYSPSTGRFLSEDPIAYEWREINFYSYATNDPADYRDPFGLVKVKVGGYVITVHQNDPDPYPSTPHGHLYPSSQKVNVNTGEIVKESRVVGRLTPKQLAQLRRALRKAGILAALASVGLELLAIRDAAADDCGELAVDMKTKVGGLVGGLAGAWAGAEAGAAIGLLAGSVVPGLGNIAGGAIGIAAGLIGGLIGGALGEEAGEFYGGLL